MAKPSKTAEPCLHDPQWTDEDRDFKLTNEMSDDLSTNAEGRFNLIPRLLPGITTQTRRARYYAFWTWVIDEFRLDRSIKHNSDSFTEFIRPRENALLLAFFAHGCNGSANGKLKGRKIWADGQQSRYNVSNWQALPSMPRGGYRQAYGGPLRDMNITEEADGYPKLTPSAVTLAKQYRQSIARTRYFQEFRDKEIVPRVIIEEMAPIVCLDVLDRFPVERACLIDLFFRFDTSDAFHIQRLQSLSFFLDLIDQSRGQPIDDYEFRLAIFYRAFADGTVYQARGDFAYPADQWRLLQMQQYFIFSVESLWSLFLWGIHDQWQSVEGYVGWLMEGLQLREVVRRFSISLSSRTSFTVKDWLDAISCNLPSGFASFNSRSRFARLGEESLTEQLFEHRDLLLEPITKHADTVRQVYGALPILLLTLLYFRFRRWREERKELWELARYRRWPSDDSYNDDRLPVDRFFADLEYANSSRQTFAEWLVWFHTRYFVAQHQRVTISRLLSQRKEMPSFEYDELTGSILGQRLRQPNMNGIPWNSSLNILQDLSLISENEQGGYKLTHDGKALLAKYKNYSMPTPTLPTRMIDSLTDSDETSEDAD